MSPTVDQEADGRRSKRRLHLMPMLLSVAVGALLGSSLFVLDYAEGLSYLSDDPASCVNCHVMRSQYEGWLKAPHATVATCNDCHTPHDVVGKYLAKARNGWNHSVAFTLGTFEDPIRIKPYNAEILNENCRRCHEALVGQIIGHERSDADAISCVPCHRWVGHGPSG